jgi:hypothetical protein
VTSAASAGARSRAGRRGPSAAATAAVAAAAAAASEPGGAPRVLRALGLLLLLLAVLLLFDPANIRSLSAARTGKACGLPCGGNRLKESPGHLVDGGQLELEQLDHELQAILNNGKQRGQHTLLSGCLCRFGDDREAEEGLDEIAARDGPQDVRGRPGCKEGGVELLAKVDADTDAILAAIFLAGWLKDRGGGCLDSDAVGREAARGDEALDRVHIEPDGPSMSRPCRRFLAVVRRLVQ